MRTLTKDGGCYVVSSPAQTRDIAEPSLAEAASLLGLKTTELNNILAFCQPLPIARIATREQAATIAEKLRPLGIETVTITEEELRPEIAPTKIRALEFSDESLAGLAVGSGAKVSACWDDVIVIVAGRLLVNRVEVEERRRRGRNQLVDTREVFADESVLDIYPKSDDAGWRIAAGSFDFSCLGSAKAVTTFENFTTLTTQLRGRSTHADFDDLYNRARPALATVWPLEQQARKGKWRRSGAGKFEMATVTTTENEAQFNRYSRLRWRLKLRELENCG